MTGMTVFEINTDACAGKDYEVNYLEHVQCVVSLNSTRRGDVTLYLISPSGTRCFLFEPANINLLYFDVLNSLDQ